MSDNDDKTVIEVYEIAVMKDGNLAWVRRSPTDVKLQVDLASFEVVLLRTLSHIQRVLQSADLLMRLKQGEGPRVTLAERKPPLVI